VKTAGESKQKESTKESAPGCGLRLAIAAAMAVLIGIPIWLWFAFIAKKPDPYANVLFAAHPLTVARGVHMLGKLAPSAAYVIETSDGLILIDTGIEADARSVVSQFRSLDLDPREIRAIFLTHAHGDHVLGARRLRELSGAKVHAGAGDAGVIEAGASRVAFFSTFGMDHVPIHGTRVDVRLKGGEKITVGDATIEAIALPGHTPGSTCYAMERDGLRFFFGGDVISSLVGDIGIYSTYLAPRYRGDASDYLASLRKLRELPAPDVVLPGHALFGEPHGPRVSPDQWLALLDDNIRSLEILTARYKADGRDFLDGAAKELLPGLYYLGDRGERAVYVLDVDDRRYVFNAPGASQGGGAEDDGLAPFVAERLARLRVKEAPIAAVVLTSCESEAIAGLTGLVRQTNCSVIVPPEGEAAVRDACPEGTQIAIATDHNAFASPTVRCVPLGGRGLAPAAYLIERDSRLALISAEIPIKVSDPSVMRLFAQLQPPHGDPWRYDQSIRQLEELSPKLWLPAVPVHGQNANLYGNEWLETLRLNLDVLQSAGRP
jgi:metallo-beta-lactamase class B